MFGIFELNPFSILGLFAGMLFGLAVVAFISRFAHAGLRDRYEEAKALGARGTKPSTVLAIAKLFAFFVFPALGVIFCNVLAGGAVS